MIWALYAWAVGSVGLLVSGVGPSWLWMTIAVLSLVGSIALLARQAVRA